MNNYIQTLQTKTSDLKQGKRLWLLYKIEFLCKSTLVSEFKNYVDFALTKVAFDTFKINKKKSSCYKILPRKYVKISD